MPIDRDTVATETSVGSAHYLLHARFDAQAARTPDRIAIRDPARAISYRDLELESDRIAGALVARGIGSGSAIGLHVDRSVAYVAAALGILKANAAVVPLPPAYPEARLRDILAFARLDAVVADRAELAAADGTRVLPLAGLNAAAGPAGKVQSGAAFPECLRPVFVRLHGSPEADRQEPSLVLPSARVDLERVAICRRRGLRPEVAHDDDPCDL